MGGFCPVLAIEGAAMSSAFSDSVGGRDAGLPGLRDEAFSAEASGRPDVAPEN